MNGQTDRTAPPPDGAMPDDTPTLPNLPKRVPQRPGRHRAKPDTPTRHLARANTPSSIATWSGARHYRQDSPEVAR